LIYLDSSALVRMIAPEPESTELSDWIRDNQEHGTVTSAMSKADVTRTFRETGAAAEELARNVLEHIDSVPVEDGVLNAAAGMDGGMDLLGAVHLASALRMGDQLHAFVSYDAGLLEAAERAGLTTASPGRRQAGTQG
jgi:predicted nucleic acid-binding protein